MFIQNKGQVTLTIELLDTEEAQGDDPLDIQVLSQVIFYDRKDQRICDLFLKIFKTSGLMG